MPARTDPAPAIKILKQWGWTYEQPIPDRHNCFWMKTPSGERLRVEFRGRKKLEKGHRQRFAIFYNDFAHVDRMIFWVPAEPIMLLVPTDFLEKLFDPGVGAIDENDRWIVRIVFNRNDKTELVLDKYPKDRRFHDLTFARLAIPLLAEPLAIDQREQGDLGPEEADDSGSNGDNYNPDGIDARPIVDRQIRERRGRRHFRNELRKRYGDRCMVTGCEILAILEAAHIIPHRGEKDDKPTNGLLLRADIHTLFDLNLLGIEPNSLKVELHPDIEICYRYLRGVLLGVSNGRHPSRDALRIRYGEFKRRVLKPS